MKTNRIVRLRQHEILKIYQKNFKADGLLKGKDKYKVI